MYHVPFTIYYFSNYSKGILKIKHRDAKTQSFYFILCDSASLRLNTLTSNLSPYAGGTEGVFTSHQTHHPFRPRRVGIYVSDLDCFAVNARGDVSCIASLLALYILAYSFFYQLKIRPSKSDTYSDIINIGLPF